jgi:hypothetical protein
VNIQLLAFGLVLNSSLFALDCPFWFAKVLLIPQKIHFIRSHSNRALINQATAVAFQADHFDDATLLAKLRRLKFLRVSDPDGVLCKTSTCCIDCAINRVHPGYRGGRKQFLSELTRPVFFPMAGDVVAYYEGKHFRHLGLVKKVDSRGNVTVESKWGFIPGIIEHQARDVPSSYGNTLRYHRILSPVQGAGR